MKDKDFLKFYIKDRIKELKKHMEYHLESMDSDYEFRLYHKQEYLIYWYSLHELEDILALIENKGE